MNCNVVAIYSCSDDSDTANFEGGNRCKDREAGSHSNLNATNDCSVCEDGKFQEFVGRTTCYLFRVGEFTNSDFSSKTYCDLCVSGYFAETTGTSENKLINYVQIICLFHILSV